MRNVRVLMVPACTAVLGIAGFAAGQCDPPDFGCCGEPDAGNCFIANGTPGCDIAPCCDAVCSNFDAFCCQAKWDNLCAESAMDDFNLECPFDAPGDDCGAATPVVVPQEDIPYDNTGANTDGPAPSCGVGGADIWLQFNWPGGDIFVNNCLESGIDTIVDVFSGNCGALTEIACQEDGIGCTGGASILIPALPAGTYLVRISGVGGAEGAGTIDIVEGVGCPGSGGDCCVANGTPGCDNIECCQIVCTVDPFCCNTSWDGICAGEAGDLCDPTVCVPPVCGDASAGDCCFGNGTPACNDLDCCNTVCAADAFCCDTAWDDVCAAAAADMCGGLCDACDLPDDPGATDEGETCGDDNNGGCNSAPPVFGAISCGETVSGTGWATGGMRDTDWLQFTIAGTTDLTANIVSQFPSVVFFVDGIAGCAPVVVGVTGGASSCAEVAPATVSIGAGTYVVFVGPGNAGDGSGVFEGFPCGTANDYLVTLDCGGGTPCPTDLDGDGSTGVLDLVALIGAWGPNPGHPADFDGNGSVGVLDLIALIGAWGPCP